MGGFFLEGLPTTVVSEALQHVVMARESLRDKTWYVGHMLLYETSLADHT